MKKLITLLAFVALFSLEGCTGPEGPIGPVGPRGDDALSPQAFEIKNVNLNRISNNEFTYYNTFQSAINGNLYDDETLLVYRLVEIINSSTPVWELLPRTINFLNNDYIEYYFNFSKVDFKIIAYGNYNLTSRPDFIDNQTFRIVILPSKLATNVNKLNYNQVMSSLKINESQVIKN